jgi:diamine N-acetyltransferase
MINDKFIGLRAIEPLDVDTLYRWENDMTLWQVSNTLTPFSRHQLLKYIESAALDIYQTKQLRLIIEFVDKPECEEPIGLLDLFDYDPFHNRGGVGIMVHEKWRNKGVASTALELFIPYAFNHLGLHQLYCNISETNLSSIRLFEKAGFNLIGIKQQWLKTLNGYENECMYQLINADR